MSGINLQDPQVLKNYIKSQILEGKGEYVVKENVLVFKGNDGNQFIVPDDLKSEMDVKENVDAPVGAKSDEKPVVVKKKAKKS